MVVKKDIVKVFISQPMVDKTDEQIKEERNRAILTIKEKFIDTDLFNGASLNHIRQFL